LVVATVDLAAVPVAGFFGAGAGNAFGCGFGAGAGKALGCEGAGARYMGWLKAFLPPVTLLLRPSGLLAVLALGPGAFV
jgi:hypothetical protein